MKHTVTVLLVILVYNKIYVTLVLIINSSVRTALMVIISPKFQMKIMVSASLYKSKRDLIHVFNLNALSVILILISVQNVIKEMIFTGYMKI